MFHQLPTCRNAAPLAWLLSAVLALSLSGCSLMGNSDLADNESTSAASELATTDAAAETAPAEDLDLSPDGHVSRHRTAELQLDVPPIRLGPIVPVSAHRESQPEDFTSRPGALTAKQQEPAEHLNTEPRPRTVAPAPAGSGNVEKIGERDFHDVVLQSEVPVLVDFYADWCGPCKRLSPILDQMARERSDVRVVKVNIDHDKQLARKYGVRSIPTMIVFQDGSLVAQHTGLPNIQKALGQ